MAQLPQPALLLVAGSSPREASLAAELDAWTSQNGLRLEIVPDPADPGLKEIVDRKRLGAAVLDARGATIDCICDFLQEVHGANPRLQVVVYREDAALPPALRRQERRGSATAFVATLTELGTALANALQTVKPPQTPVEPQHRTGSGPRGAAARALDMLRENQKLIEIGRLAASIAHEINNPLESITNLLYLAKCESGLPEQALHYLEMAEQELERVVTISKQTLNFSRETSLPVSVSLATLLDEVLVLYRRRLEEKQLRVERHYLSTKPALIFPGEMRQVFSNLITNAIEACAEHGSLALRIRMASSPGASERRGIRVTIADNGSGIPAEIRHRLGEPFFTTKGQRGTGLGLWVTHSIVSRYGGTLRLRSSYGGAYHGTVFSLFLPQTGATIHTLPAADQGRGAVRRARRARPIPFRRAGNGK
jgi:signal transduction histidine kinase